jgi:ABC-2 type transport system permease protein
LVIYKTLIQINFSQLLIFRSNAISSILSSIGWGILSISGMLLLTTKVQSIYGWNKNELLLLTGLYSVIIGIFYFLFARNFERLSANIVYGRLDGILLKPLDAQFSLSVWYMNFATIFRVFFASIFVGYIVYQSHIPVGLINVISFLVLLIFSITLMYSIWFIVLSLMIWFPRLSNLIDLLYSFNDTTRYPPEMYKRFHPFVFYFALPYTFVLVSPLKALLGKILFGDVAGLIICALSFFICSRIIWKFALRYYTSASG